MRGSENSKIQKTVDRADKKKEMSLKKVYIVLHTHKFKDDTEDIKIIGIYRSKEAAKAAIKRKKKMPGFAENPNGFEVDAYELDKDEWPEGYVVLTL